MSESRLEQFNKLFPKEPVYRRKQFLDALYSVDYQSWKDATCFSLAIRETLEKEIPWMHVKIANMLESKGQDTFKALLEVEGGDKIETVLMKNRRGWWTLCVSSQVGCAMRCAFCATGRMGLKRNLNADEIVDQYRFWLQFLRERSGLSQRITNIVYMGMGEPMSNYENVRASLNEILTQTEIGLTRITVSTVGVLPRLETLLNDPLWPHVRIAVSLHSADPKTRKQIVPSSYEDFLPKLADWAKRYLKKFGNARHHLTFEYVLLNGVNDSLVQAKALEKYVKKIGDVRVNLIPFNSSGQAFDRSGAKNQQGFFEYLDTHNICVTARRPMGEDIAAACGQLVVQKEKQ
ncbi:MAG: 23S rRNA (adenine(2503)-C(2))-methyltransferase RlmN [Patescibacteria group bacterium]